MILIFLQILLLAGVVAYSARYFISSSKRYKKPARIYWQAFFFGVTATLYGMVIESLLIPHKFNPDKLSLNAFYGGLMVGVIEEAIKFLPYALFVYGKPYFKKNIDGIVLFVIVGLGSAFMENMFTIFDSGPIASTIRLPFILFHSAATAIVGYYLIQSKINHRSFILPTIALLLVSIIHGFFDFSVGALNLVLALSAVVVGIMLIKSLFIFYRRARKADALRG